MCYLIAKNNQGGSSLAIQMMHGKELAKLKQKLLSDLSGEERQRLAVSRRAPDPEDAFMREIISKIFLRNL